MTLDSDCATIAPNPRDCPRNAREDLAAAMRVRES
ncbi:hypothetical protein Thivi_2236 [Thiocystis violascens DSM 198]|uniref:Uncharacterized protein n=1 Tax=Thiocystis violascens (strain ATCC 17096 / DSM 198 / 6111) TaxID=765911 RepID=I3YB17_THIV6|nr:hypothetical protein Thivi_2236 [Thiocystis violascens DSM 198]